MVPMGPWTPGGWVELHPRRPPGNEREGWRVCAPGQAQDVNLRTFPEQLFRVAWKRMRPARGLL